MNTAMLKTNFLIVALLCLFLGTGNAQDRSGFSNVFDTYSQRENTVSFNLNKTMLDAVDIDLEWEEKMRHVSGDIHRLRFLAFDKNDESSKIVKSLDQKIRDLGYPVIPFKPDLDTDDIKQFKLYGVKEGAYYKQVHLLLQDDEGRAFLISVDGKLKVAKEA